MSTSSCRYLGSIFIIVNPTYIEPIHCFQIRILGRIADAHDGIGLHILAWDQELLQHSLPAKLRMDFLFAIALFTVSLPTLFSEWHTDMCSHKWDYHRHH